MDYKRKQISTVFTPVNKRTRADGSQPPPVESPTVPPVKTTADMSTEIDDPGTLRHPLVSISNSGSGCDSSTAPTRNSTSDSELAVNSHPKSVDSNNSAYAACMKTRIPSSRKWGSAFEREMHGVMQKYFYKDIPDLIDLAAPRNQASKEKANEYIATICNTLEIIATTSSSNMNADILCGGLWKVDSRPDSENEVLRSKLKTDYAAFDNWINPHFDDSDSDGDSDNESDGGSNITERSCSFQKRTRIHLFSFICFVARCVQALHSRSPNMLSHQNPQYIFVPCWRTINKGKGTGSATRVDVGIPGKGLDQEVFGPKYTERQFSSPNIDTAVDNRCWYWTKISAVAISDGKSESDETKAYLQLFWYARNIFKYQHFRRFAWGLAVSNRVVQASIFAPNFAAGSADMDVRTAKGRREFVRLLVYWSFNTTYEWGLDPHVRYYHDKNYFRIQVPVEDDCDDGLTGPRMKTYYSNKDVCSAEWLFGRRTRCFLATDIEPTDEKPISELVPTVFIKDAWTVIRNNLGIDVCDEIAHQRKITQTLKRYPELAGTYTVLEAGGRVEYQLGNDDGHTEDTTCQIFGDLLDRLGDNENSREVLECVHKRIATSPIGMSLTYVESIPELIIVVADAMRAHRAIFKHCNILHRDISEGNILFQRLEDGSVKGMLIDFDHAIDAGSMGSISDSSHVGTVAFMSINNLEGNANPRTELDDWESIIYVLLWAGVFGLQRAAKNDTPATANANNPSLIDCWMKNNAESLAKDKRKYMHSSEMFTLYTDKLNKRVHHWQVLKKLLEKLRDTLIDNVNLNNLNYRYTGAQVRKYMWQPDCDPFGERSYAARSISKEMMQYLDECAKECKEMWTADKIRANSNWADKSA
ncbi:hypothetical protein GGF37_000655 [Kickxella alabastrina]|nr:hypothetical protein GGF37_000655 [Kickxella alabastrina]